MLEHHRPSRSTPRCVHDGGRWLDRPTSCYSSLITWFIVPVQTPSAVIFGAQ
jgi:hypothetical protein